jgi:large subunit ribosomal protein L31
MKSNIHPKYIHTTTVTCNSCSKVFIGGSIKDAIHVEICSNCHPFYTGKAKIVDTENLVKKFEERNKLVDSKKIVEKKQKRIERNKKSTEVKASQGITLRDMLKQLS